MERVRRWFLRIATTPMPSFDLGLGRPEPPSVVWDRLWDLDRHTASVPLTTVTATDGAALGPASRFVGRTDLGPIHLDDRMVVREWQPPRRAVIEKVGMPRGTITVTLTSDAEGTRVRWQQSFGAVGVPNGLARLATPLVARGYRAALLRILSDPVDAASV